ncbi:MAG: VCBS repeat-containing protein, partial [bacterium]|nr:VCBS repeat-containing protein [bacterium]
LFLANYGPNVLLRNDGAGAGGKVTFSDVTEKAGVRGPEKLKGFPKWSLHGSFFDYDRDGLLDLYVANYLAFDPEYRYFFGPEGFPGPLSYEGQPDILYRNNGDGTFSDVTEKAGLHKPKGRAMSVGVVDIDGDRHADIFVANDAMENYLFRSQGDGTFKEEALVLGVGFGEFGEATSSMAPIFEDFDGDGDFDLFVPDMGYSCLYRNEGKHFVEMSAISGIAAACGQYTSWAPVTLDYDNDGLLDLYVTNGDAHHLYTEEDLLFRNRGKLRFEDVSLDSGDYFTKSEYVGRGAAGGDWDNDGDVDVLVANVNGPLVLLRNDGGNRNHWLTVRTIGTKSNRDGIGTR